MDKVKFEEAKELVRKISCVQFVMDRVDLDNYEYEEEDVNKEEIDVDINIDTDWLKPSRAKELCEIIHNYLKWCKSELEDEFDNL